MTHAPHRRPTGLHIAALSAVGTGLKLAMLAATMTLSAKVDAQGFGEAQLLPHGEFAARDGRPGAGKTWKINDAQGHQVAAALNAIATRTPLVIDYEHQTLSAAENGHPAPAAGWIHQAEWRDGQGLFARVKWTAAAKARIDAEEYRFFSPVIAYDDAGLVTNVLMGALVNYPALLGMEPVVAALSAFSRHQPTEPQMDRAALIALLGLAADATDAQINAAVAKLSGELPGLRTAAARPLLSAPLATALGVAAGADEAAALSAVAALRTAQAAEPAAAMAAITALQGQVAALQGQLGAGEVTRLVDQAINERRALPALREFLTQMGTKDIAQLKAYIATSPVLEGLQGQSGGQERGGGTAALAGQANQVMNNFGLTTEQWAKGAPAQTH